MIIIKSKQEQRKAHWQEIKNRVTTHEGELLHGKKGKEYQQKYSKSYLGIDMTPKPIDFNRPEYQEELNRTT